MELATKREIATRLAKKYHLPVVTTIKVVQGVLDEIINILAKKDRLELRNFGVFIVKTRKPRPARNLKTGETIMIPKRRVVTFKASGELLKKIKK